MIAPKDSCIEENR